MEIMVEAAPKTTAAPSAPKLLSKKFIRTFAGDMEMLQKGGVPDLAPLENSSQGSGEWPKRKESILTRLPPVPPPPPPPPVPKPEPLKTYAGDFSDKVKREGASPVTVLAVEQDAAPRVRLESTSNARSNRMYILAGVLLILIGGIGAAVAYLRYQAALVPVILTPGVRAPIFVDDREELSGTGGELVQAIQQSITRPLGEGAVRLLYLPPATTTQDVFSQLNISAPGVLLRNIQPIGSMAGVVNAGGEQSPFFILSVMAYGTTFSGMLGWETVMPRALAPLYPAYRGAAVDAAARVASVATSTATTTDQVPAAKPGFRDEDVANHDVRIYRDAEGRSLLLYGYWNQNTLVIARSPEAFAEVLERLATSREE